MHDNDTTIKYIPSLAPLANLPLEALPLELAEAIESEEERYTEVPASGAEEGLYSWLAKGITPEPWPSTDPEIMLAWIDPTDGGGTLESANLTRQAWWLSMQRLKTRLVEFLALEIPEPEEITADMVKRWQEAKDQAPPRVSCDQAGRKRTATITTIPAQKTKP